MTKGGIHAFTRSLSAPPDRQGHPRERRRAGAGVDAAQPGRQAAPRRSAKFGADTPMKRPAQPEEIAPAYRLPRLAPDCSSYITGEILPIIGGYAGG